MAEKECKDFLECFAKKVEKKSKRLNQLLWILETTGSSDAASLQAELATEYKLLFSDKDIFEKLKAWKTDSEINDPLIKRQIEVLLLAFKGNMMDPNLLEEISNREAKLSQSYVMFRPKLEGKVYSENEIREVLKSEKNPGKRKAVWNLSKEIGNHLALQIRELVKLRNQAAKSLGYPDFFQMQLELQEVDKPWLFKTLEDLYQDSEKTFSKITAEIQDEQARLFQVEKNELGPWAWGEPFSQEDPLGHEELDSLVEGLDFVKEGQSFFQKMGFDVETILNCSDLYEREGKNQHAFCIHIDRKGDVRTLNNLKMSIRWLETLLHELGHAVYELGYAKDLPWLLRDPPHMISTEAMALICGRQVYLSSFLSEVVQDSKKKALIKQAEKSLRRRQLIFSRWVLVMTYFESELYANPDQDLQKLWWSLVEKYQKVSMPKNRENENDWAAKYHIGLAPVYYFSYLLGEMFASSLTKKFEKDLNVSKLQTAEVGTFLQKKLFNPGSSYRWDELIEHVLEKPFTSKEWVEQFCL